MNDLYLIPNSTVLKNLLGITNEKELDLAEAELSRANMMLLYENGFSDFSSGGFCFIHKFLFGDVYEWAGQYRKINIQKREELLAGRSVWYSNVTEIGADLDRVFAEIKKIDWASLTRKDFAKQIARLFPKLWQVHPFREGNTRTTVMMMTFFVERYGYYFDQILWLKVPAMCVILLFLQALASIRNMNIWKKYCLMQFVSSLLNMRMVIENPKIRQIITKNTSQKITLRLNMSILSRHN